MSLLNGISTGELYLIASFAIFRVLYAKDRELHKIEWLDILDHLKMRLLWYGITDVKCGGDVGPSSLH